MKRIILYGVFSLTAAALVGCGHSQPKAPPPTDVIDAGMTSADPISVKEHHVFDAGTFRDNEDNGSNLVDRGGRNGQVVPVEKFYSVDREKFAPVDKTLYVLTDDSPARCIKAKYIMSEGHKQLVVFTQSKVPSNFCIYQKTASAEAEGFSIYVSDGGMCKPSYTTINTDDQKRKVASIDNVDKTVSFTHCVDGTTSYGEKFGDKH